MSKESHGISQIVEICYVRHLTGKNCKDCIYYGKRCDNWKHKHMNMKPHEYDDYKFKKENRNGN